MKGIIIINLGTPDSPNVKDVRRYLRQFLNDPMVLDTYAAVRWFVVNIYIPLLRAKSSAHAYQAIWDQEKGSPLLYHSQDFVDSLSDFMGDTFQVVLGMRYGNPSIESAVKSLLTEGIDDFLIIPMFPQFARATTGSIIAEVLRCFSVYNFKYKIMQSFYKEDAFIEAYASILEKHITNTKQTWDHILFSYHGLPIKSSSLYGDCCNRDFCFSEDFCYRQQCITTSKTIAEQLSLRDDQYSISFQSRFGRTPWITPYTNYSMLDLISQGKEHLIITCPSFVVDCLETIEEIGIRAQEDWMYMGGKSFVLLECLNSNKLWVKRFADMIKSNL